MAPMPVEETVSAERLAAARAVAAAAVRVSATGKVSVRMPRLGSVWHGSVEAALRGCPCHPCDRTRDDLLADLLADQDGDQVEVEGLGTPPVSPVPVLVPEPVVGLGEGPQVEGGPVTAPAEPAEPAEQLVAGVGTDRVDGSPVPAADAGPARKRPVVDLPAGLVVDLPADISAAAGLAARRVVQGHAVDDADCTRLLLTLGLATELKAAGAASDTGPDTGPDVGLDLVDLVDLDADGGRGAAA